MHYTELAVISLTASCIFFLPLILLSIWGIRRRMAKGAKHGAALSESTIDTIVARVVAKTEDKEAATLGQLNAHIVEIREDFDWLVSNRMIEQAVEMARLGEAGEHITKQTGISSLELNAITKHRRH